MNTSKSNRLLLLSGVALLLFAILVARWIADWGLVTIHVKGAPLGKVVASITRQGHVPVESSLDPTTPVTMDVDKVTPAVAVDILAGRVDAAWRTVYLAAPTRAAIKEAVINLKGSGKLDEWTTYFYPGPPFVTETGLALDPRFIEVKIEGPAQDLPSLLDQASQKSGVMTALPKDWSPTVQQLPRENQVRKALPALVSAAHGKVMELFLLTARRHREWEGGANAENGRGSGGGGDQQDQGPRFGGAGGTMNPEWRDQRQLAEIKLLPPSEQDAAKKALEERKALFAQFMNLSPQDRMAKIRQMMSNPDNVQRMMDQQLLRQASQTADQRITRAVNYINRKATLQASQGTISPAPMPSR